MARGSRAETKHSTVVIGIVMGVLIASGSLASIARYELSKCFVPRFVDLRAYDGVMLSLRASGVWMVAGGYGLQEDGKPVKTIVWHDDTKTFLGEDVAVVRKKLCIGE